MEVFVFVYLSLHEFGRKSLEGRQPFVEMRFDGPVVMSEFCRSHTAGCTRYDSCSNTVARESDFL